MDIPFQTIITGQFIAYSLNGERYYMSDHYKISNHNIELYSHLISDFITNFYHQSIEHGDDYLSVAEKLRIKDFIEQQELLSDISGLMHQFQFAPFQALYCCFVDYCHEFQFDLDSVQPSIDYIYHQFVEYFFMNREQADYPSVLVVKSIHLEFALHLNAHKFRAIIVSDLNLNDHVRGILCSLGIPIIKIDENDLYLFKNKCTVLFNGKRLILNPTLEEVEQWNRQREIYVKCREDDNKKSKIKARCYLAINGMSDLKFCDYRDIGIGLVRTENLFIKEQKELSIEEQRDFYQELSDYSFPQRVVIRTADFSSEKRLASMKDIDSDGVRGIRYSLSHPTQFRRQLCAIMQASSAKNVAVMLPYVSVLDEIIQVKRVIGELAEELQKKRIPFDPNITLGVMIETMSAVFMLEELIKQVNFVSIGTNDLLQSLMNASRSDQATASYYSFYQPSFIRCLNRIVLTCRQYKKEVYLCGEMASDRRAIPLLLGLGFRFFSVSVGVYQSLSGQVSQYQEEFCKKIVGNIINMNSSEDVEKYLSDITMQIT